VLFTVKDPKSVHAFVRQALEGGNRITYLSIQSSAELTGYLSESWPDVETYITSNRLSIQSAYDYFPGGGHKIGKNANTNSPARRSVKNSIVVLCPAAVSSYVKVRLYESRSQSESIGFRVKSVTDFEASVVNQFVGRTLVCCVFDRFVRTLDIVSLLLLINHHKFAIGRDGQIMPLSEDAIMDAIKRALDFVMGDGSSSLILKTLRFVYHVYEDDILQDPSVCFGRIEKMLGEPSANKIRSAASREIRKLIIREQQLGTALQN
jgi:hypothetical protein